MDPLAQLNDIHLPDNVHNYPLALGWWLLALLMLAFIIYITLKLLKARDKRKAKRTAIKQLAATTDIASTIALLKWAALQYFPREHVAHITGDRFKAFLVSTLPMKQQENFKTLTGDHFSLTYQHRTTENESAEFSAAAKLWLSSALPPKNTKLPTTNSSATMSVLTKTPVVSIEKPPSQNEVKS